MHHIKLIQRGKVFPVSRMEISKAQLLWGDSLFHAGRES